MKQFLALMVVALTLALGVPKPANAVVHHTGKSVGVIMPPDSRDCFFFQLVGVGQADPVTTGSPWFAVPKAHNGFKEIFALLLWAKASGSLITVETSGQAESTCSGLAGIWQVYTAS